MLAIYPAHAIHYRWVVIRALLDTRFLGEKVVVHLGHRQINKVIITQSPPYRSGHSFIDKTNNTVHLVNASYTRGTETAGVEGLWLSKRP